jgi:hypothetical protein
MQLAFSPFQAGCPPGCRPPPLPSRPGRCTARIRGRTCPCLPGGGGGAWMGQARAARGQCAVTQLPPQLNPACRHASGRALHARRRAAPPAPGAAPPPAPSVPPTVGPQHEVEARPRLDDDGAAVGHEVVHLDALDGAAWEDGGGRSCAIATERGVGGGRARALAGRGHARGRPWGSGAARRAGAAVEGAPAAAGACAAQRVPAPAPRAARVLRTAERAVRTPAWCAPAPRPSPSLPLG